MRIKEWPCRRYHSRSTSERCKKASQRGTYTNKTPLAGSRFVGRATTCTFSTGGPTICPTRASASECAFAKSESGTIRLTTSGFVLSPPCASRPYAKTPPSEFAYPDKPSARCFLSSVEKGVEHVFASKYGSSGRPTSVSTLAKDCSDSKKAWALSIEMRLR
jgi:hypothetical protein